MNAKDMAAVLADYGDAPIRIRMPDSRKVVVSKIELMGDAGGQVVDILLTDVPSNRAPAIWSADWGAAANCL
jgi:hypothetical protein